MAGSFGMVLFIYGNLEAGRLQDEGGDGGAPGAGALGTESADADNHGFAHPVAGSEKDGARCPSMGSRASGLAGKINIGRSSSGIQSWE